MEILSCSKNNNFLKSKGKTKSKKIILNGKAYFLKRDKVRDDYVKEFGHDTVEHIFYKNSIDKAKKDNMDKFLNFPIKMINCNGYNMYLYKMISKDYTNSYISSLSDKSLFLDYTIQLCLEVFYLNHELGYFHNDFAWNGLWNVMIDKNYPGKISFGNFDYDVKDNRIRLIDFGHTRKYQFLRTNEFYTRDSKRKNFKFISEVFCAYYICMKMKKFISGDKWDNYKLFINKLEQNNISMNMKNFDELIIKSLIKLNS